MQHENAMINDFRGEANMARFYSPYHGPLIWNPCKLLYIIYNARIQRPITRVYGKTLRTVRKAEAQKLRRCV